MRAGSVVREAWRNIASGTTRAIVLASVLTLVMVALVSADLLTIRQILDRATAFHASGGSVLVLTSQGRINGAICDEFGFLPGVRAAGAIRNTEMRIVAATLPSAPIPLTEVSPGFSQVVRANPQGAGVLLGPEVSVILDSGKSGQLATTTGSLPIAGRYEYPDDGRRPGFSYAILAPSNNLVAYDECWVDVWPQVPGIASLILTAVTPSGGEAESSQISQLNTSLGTSYDGNLEYSSRVTRWSPPSPLSSD